ncbi:S41 family peptidase [Subsaximicrobium wynnwilliamsii]|uniref:S41 family peptidase n=1 Tax=Subsaximicrobium wynnwilliamsii TaxID=291179 RepID=A0A5C6ZCU9_9FLAO|nr:S41 family peptidase [Subsaximicrobium wynnwilliamsii]TXD81205.1 S41 family peptidase [Subsaximicrobium wynnwilliamsii]TXD86923.1 S41 family peptidase [Subsaximicrobium wynnwilliamsii]TXE00552.1 S41 family peptidase [Subsaximicrobium wynnwilliamsii]
MKPKTKYIPLLLGLAVALGIVIGGKLNFTDTSDRLFTTNSKKDKLNRLIDYIDYEYVDDVNTDSIVDVTVNGILDNLDPHSTYIPKSDLERVTNNMKGDFVGIGVNFYTYNDTVTVIRPLAGGPSEKAGIKGGDRIIMADGDSIFGKDWSNDDIIHKLQGEKGSRVALTVKRKGIAKLLKFNVKRDVIPIKSVDASYMLTKDLGYIKINRFAESTYKEFKRALNALQAQGATKLALDLRDNPGGFLAIAEQIADEFLENGKLILFTKNKSGKVENSYATKRGDFEEGEVYIMINESSASASEIVAGALQDNDKGTIVGRRSYGKGLVQREMALGDGSAIRLTVSRYYTPTGRSIQRPYDKGNSEAYYKDYFKRLSSGELDHPESVIYADSLKYTTPKGKVVYGGGGIIPDVFVPLNTSMQNETLNYINRLGYIGNFVFGELDKDRSIYEGITPEEFIQSFYISDDIILKFQEYLNFKEDTNLTFVAYHDQIKRMIKAALAEQLFGSDVAAKIFNEDDEMIEEVIMLSQGKTLFDYEKETVKAE